MDQSHPSPAASGRPKLFYGWIVVLGCALMMGTSIGLFVNCNGIFIKPVCADLNLSRGAFTLYASIASFLGMFMQVIYGDLYRKHPMLPFSRVSMFITCACVLGYSFSTKIWHFYAFAVIYGLCSTPVMVLTIASLINNWFVDKKGLAMGLAYSGSGVTAAVMTPILSGVVSDFGWRWGYRLLAVCGFVLLFVSAFVLLREKPADMGFEPLGAGKKAQGGDHTSELVGVTRAKALKSPEFYMMVFGFAALATSGMGVNPHVVSYLTDVGYSQATASSVMSIIMTVMIFAKIALGAIFDRVGAVLASALSGACMMISLLMLILCPSAGALPFVFAFCFGFGYSTISVPFSFITIENFGAREFAAIFSLASMLSGIFSSFGPTITGVLYDLTGSYLKVWPLYLVLVGVATVVMTFGCMMALKKNYNPHAIRPGKAKS